MLDQKFVANVAERDVDLLIMEELSVSDEFREWFSSRVFGEPIFQSEIGAWHSVSDGNLGESDLVYLFQAIEDGPRTAILIENKIDAPPQPKQGDRYRLRGDNGLKQGFWDGFKTCVIAPSEYLSSSKHSEIYDAEISYEELLAYFQSRSPRDKRFSYKARILLVGIVKHKEGYQPKYSEEMTKFVEDYHTYVTDKYPRLGIQEAKPRPAGSTWVMFYPKSLPKGVNLVHQLTAGVVKVFFYGQAEAFESLKAKYEPILPSNAAIALAGKSVAISIEVPKIAPLSKPFSEQQENVEQALQYIVQLEGIVSVHGGI